MKLTKGFLAIFVLILSLNSFGQKDCDYQIDTSKILSNQNLDSFLNRIQRETFSVNCNKNGIPSFIKKQLDCWTHNFSIANCKEPYNATDVYDKKLPNRQLLFLALNNDLFIMTYLRGGIGGQTHIVFIRFHDSKIVDLWTGICLQELTTKNQVLNYIKTHRNKHLGLNTNMIYF